MAKNTQKELIDRIRHTRYIYYIYINYVVAETHKKKEGFKYCGVCFAAFDPPQALKYTKRKPRNTLRKGMLSMVALTSATLRAGLPLKSMPSATCRCDQIPVEIEIICCCFVQS